MIKQNNLDVTRHKNLVEVRQETLEKERNQHGTTSGKIG
jgi:hypothetical protein